MGLVQTHPSTCCRPFQLVQPESKGGSSEYTPTVLGFHRRGRRRRRRHGDVGVRLRLAGVEPRVRPRRPPRRLRQGLPPRLLPGEHGPQGHAGVPREDRHAGAPPRVHMRTPPNSLCSQFSTAGWGVAYKISREQDKQTALEYLEVREKQYDEKIYLELYTDSSPKIPAVENMMVYLATTNKEANQNYLGPAPLEEMAKQIYLAEGPSGPNKEYLFKLKDALNKIGVTDQHVQDLADAVRKYPDTM